MLHFDPEFGRPEDTGNICSLCDMIIDTDDPNKPACNCVSEIDQWSENDLRDAWDDLPTRIQEYYKPPRPLIEKSVHRHKVISVKYTDGTWGHYYPNVRSMPKKMFRET